MSSTKQNKKPAKCKSELIFLCRIPMRHESTVAAFRYDDMGSRCERKIIPEGWDIENDQMFGSASFITFITLDNEPFRQSDVDRVTKAVDLLDGAFDAMVAGTVAEGT